MPIQIKPVGIISQVATEYIEPLMYVLSGTIWETPQSTHRWNNQRLPYSAVADMLTSRMEHVDGNPHARRRWFGPIPLFHMPIFGGWRDYVVLMPQMHRGIWFLGWMPEDTTPGVSRIPIMGAVRALRGPTATRFFGVTEEGLQIPIYRIGIGRVGAGGPHTHLPLL